MDKWLRDKLSEFLTYPVPEDMIEYILQIENERDLDEYVSSITGCNNAKHKQFIAELKKQQAMNKDQGYKKTNNVENENTKQTGKKRGKTKLKEKQENKQVQEIVKVEKVEKKKVKYVNLYSEDGKGRPSILLKGRRKCNCEAKMHALVNNCLNCGRIVCMQEGVGPCFFCGESVQMHSGGYKPVNQKSNRGLEDSVKQRDRLLEYDRTGSQGTKVIDDECDYYQTGNTWLSAQKRELLQKLEDEKNARKHMSHLNRKVNVTFDFAGRQVVQDNPIEDYDRLYEEQIASIMESSSFSEFESSNMNPNVEFSPIYVESNESESYSTRTGSLPKSKSKIQDKEYLEMSDLGVCLSMHQPYASLLVAGIKMHEGRTWYSSHRGRLWIAATAKPPTREDISSIEQFYRVLKDENIQFPDGYPTGCLLGCVTVTDVINQEEYRKRYPDGESDSPYVFICENFSSLPVKFPIQGKHKIYKLDPKIHQAAVKMLEKQAKLRNE